MRGDITVDGHPKDPATFARVAGYVEQVCLSIDEYFSRLPGLPRTHQGKGLCSPKWIGLDVETRRWCARVMLQFDIHSPAATVREALMYSAQLRLVSADKKQLTSFVDEVPPPRHQSVPLPSPCICKSCRPEERVPLTGREAS